MSAFMDVESKQQETAGASAFRSSGRVPNLARWNVDTVVEAREYDADSAENEVLLPEVESIAKSRLSRVILPSGSVILCSGAVLLRQCLAVQPLKDQLLSQAIVLNFQPAQLFPDASLIDFFSKLHRFNLNEDEPLAKDKAGWKPEWCYLVRALNMPAVYQEAQQSLNYQYQQGVWEWIRVLRHSTPDDRKFRNCVINLLCGMVKPRFVNAIIDEHLDDLFSILDDDDIFTLAHSRWVFRGDLPAQPAEVDEPAGEGEPPRFLPPKVQYGRIALEQQTEAASAEPRTIILEVAATLSPDEQIHIVVNSTLTVIGSLEVLRRKSRMVQAATDNAATPVQVQLEGAERMNADDVVGFFNMLHSDELLDGVKESHWKVCWVSLADQLQVDEIQERLNRWFWTLAPIRLFRDFWGWVATSRMRSVQRSRPENAPSTATREDVFSVMEGNRAHSQLHAAVIKQMEQFRKEFDAMHVIRLLRLVA